ncbi:MAG: dihydropteroate synthase [Bacteroidota bacterium]
MSSSTAKTLNLGGRLLDLSIPKVIGILNVTPDSFYDGKRFETLDAAIAQAEKMVAEGVDVIDVGGYSSRPGAEHISEEDEWKRVIPVVKEIHTRFPNCPISIDTFRVSVAEKAVDAGALLVNDISGGDLDANMFPWIAATKIPYVLMHMRGTPQTMTQQVNYQHLVKELIDELHPKVHRLTQLGVKDLIIDPGFGFAKTAEQNFELLAQLEHMQIFERPVLAGLSRKSMVWRTLQITPDEALNGTTALNMVALQKGASILRVHDVAAAKQCIQLHLKLLAAQQR